MAAGVTDRLWEVTDLVAGKATTAEVGKSSMMQIPVLMGSPIATFVIYVGGAVAGVLIAWKILKPKSK
jgi:hypothetical protein